MPVVKRVRRHAFAAGARGRRGILTQPRVVLGDLARLSGPLGVGLHEEELEPELRGERHHHHERADARLSGQHPVCDERDAGAETGRVERPAGPLQRCTAHLGAPTGARRLVPQRGSATAEFGP
jgi:hypothetical protein